MIEGIQESQRQLIHEGHHNRLFRYDDRDNATVILIKLARSASPLSRQAALFANELKITQKFDHPGIRKALETGRVDGKPVLYLDYIDGVSLRDYIAAAKPALIELVSIGATIAEILAIVHGANVIHKNLNSDHVMIGPDRRPVLIDFTIAMHCTLSHATDRPDRLEGNLAYISPEQTGRINRVVDYRTDLYSLGVVLYEMLCGRLPFNGTSMAEQVHAHIAKQPQALCQRNPDVPAGLSDIVMKLLCKSTEERYQSAFGAARDLERCLLDLREKGRIESFALGRDDVSARLIIPQRLYGREKAVAQLEQAFDRTAAGSGEFVMVSGPAGSGKTLLVNELKPRVMKSGGMVVAGNYDQYRRNVPYNGFNQAFSVLSGMVGGYTPHRLSLLRSHLSRETESSQGMLKTVLPGLQTLLAGSLHEDDQSSPVSPHQPINRTVCNVLRLLARECGPLVIVLDNLQWADSASMAVLRRLAMEKGRQALLIIGVCDNEQLDDLDSLNAVGIERLLREKTIQRIDLKNLDPDRLRQLIEDMVRRSDTDTATLAGIVFDKTGGNPLLAIEFIQSLYDEGTLWFDLDTRRWCWDEAVIRELAIVDDVISSVTRRVKKLSGPIQDVLMTAACVGNAFSCEILAAMMDRAPDEVRQHLKIAQEEHLIVSMDGMTAQANAVVDDALFLGPTRFSFSHGRVRQAAYSLLPAPAKRMTHLRVGRLYLSRLCEADLKKHLFAVVDHLNEGFRYIDAEEDRLHLAELNRVAGKRARHTGAYAAAVWYLNMGLGLLPRERWARCHEQSGNLFLETIASEYLICNFPRVHMLAEELAKHAETAQMQAKARKYQILAHAAQGDRDRAFTAALTALEALNVLKQEELPEFSPVPTASPGQVDTTTIIKASHMLSREIHLDRLLDKLMQIVMENAGAQKGVLIIDHDGRMTIQARRRVGGKRVETMEALPLAKSDEVPHSVICTVVDTKSAIVLGNAHNDPQFSQDAYIRSHQTKSILGLPIVYQTKLVGVLYLENDLATNIFSTDRLQLLNALLSQAAISIENAKLYASLEEKLEELSATRDALTESHNWLDKIINAIGDPVFVKDRDHHWVLLNDALCEFMGCSRKELLGKSDYDFFPKEEADVFWAKDELVFTTGEENVNEEKFTDAHGETYTIITRKTLYADEKGNPYIVGTITDITERVNLESQLRQAQKMESVGRLAGGVAHDFNNMLSVILGYGELALHQTSPDQPMHSALQEIIKAAQRSADITRQMLAFARKQTIAPKRLDINKTIGGMINMLKRLIGEDIDLAWLPGKTVWPVMIDPGQIDQILVNLCVNARDAIADVGKVTIETGNADFDEAYCKDNPGFKAGEYTSFAVSDNGCGMNGETLEKIFEPFFTTKESGKGTGLGLATSYGIVKQNNGFINVYSEPSHGTTFKIYLPRHRPQKESLAEKEKAHTATSGHETILLVEDEPAILEITQIMLEGLGYTVIAVNTPGEAIAFARKHKIEIHLLITDVVMPEMNGRDLAKNILAVHPNVKRLFMSGYTANVIAHHGVLDEGVNFIQKPFSKRQLEAKVREALEKD